MSEKAAEMLKSKLAEMRDPDSRYNKFSVEIDCPPGLPRPSDLFPGVLTDTGLNVEDFDLITKFFGNFVWVLQEDAGKDDRFIMARPVLAERLTSLWHDRTIRYASW